MCVRDRRERGREGAVFERQGLITVDYLGSVSRELRSKRSPVLGIDWGNNTPTAGAAGGTFQVKTDQKALETNSSGVPPLLRPVDVVRKSAEEAAAAPVGVSFEFPRKLVSGRCHSWCGREGVAAAAAAAAAAAPGLNPWQEQARCGAAEEQRGGDRVGKFGGERSEADEEEPRGKLLEPASN
ncbi:hypothetical protein INR49_009252 [Caranx melampygus]|nr:hypothetical protein INR49_020624 [Caranx melampygus]KAG7232273.1 hypothetical protein INR49_009252 [Caranx melampygus]